jgi:hypothetical protein
MTTTQSLFTIEGADQRTLEFLTATVEKNNLPGFDYIEFKRAIATLISMQMEEPLAIKSAFATAATVGVTKEKLIESAGYYRNLLQKEQDQFSAALAGQTTAKVKARQEEALRLRDQIERHKAEIVRLQDEMAAYLEQADQTEKQAVTESEKIEKARSNFEQTLSSILLHIDGDVEAMHKHL